MKFGIKHQETYSRGELILRTLFGVFYMALPHLFVLIFLQLWSAILNFITFWVILFTGQFPEGMFKFQLNLRKWNLRLQARLMNLSDGYPAFGLESEDENIIIEIERPIASNRVSVLLRLIFGFFYVLIPHVFCLYFMMIGMSFLQFIAFWVVLFTGKFPVGMHTFIVGVLRWQFRLDTYMSFMTDTYPPFSTKGDEADFGLSSTPSNAALES
jgi:hypothetical protein